jgi:hypothetical protein
MGVLPPVVNVSPNVLRATVKPGGTTTRTIRVCNDGGSQLQYRVSASERPRVAAAPGAVESGPLDHRKALGAESPGSSLAVPTTEAESGVETEPASSWITIDDPSGALAPAQCVDVTVRLNAAGLRLGDHFANLEVETNDPARPVVTTGVQLHVAQPVAVEFDLEARRLDPRERFMKRRIEASIEAPRRFKPQQIDVSSIRLNGEVAVDRTRAPRVRGHGRHAELVVWFQRSDLVRILPAGDRVKVTVTGNIANESFVGHDFIKVERSRLHRPYPREILSPSQSIAVTYDVSEEAAEVRRVALLSSFNGGADWRVESASSPNTGRIPWKVPWAQSDSALLAVVELDEEGDSSAVALVLSVSEYFSIQRGGSATEGAREAPPAVTELLPISPNPSSGPVPIRFALGQRERVGLEVFDAQGRAVRAMALGLLEPGLHEVVWDGRNQRGALAEPGLYFVRLSMGSRVWTRRVVRMN